MTTSTEASGSDAIPARQSPVWSSQAGASVAAPGAATLLPFFLAIAGQTPTSIAGGTAYVVGTRADEQKPLDDEPGQSDEWVWRPRGGRGARTGDEQGRETRGRRGLRR